MFLRYCGENLWLRSGTSGGSCRIGGRKFPGRGLFLSAAPSRFRSLFSFAHQRARSLLPKRTSPLPRERNRRLLPFRWRFFSGLAVSITRQFDREIAELPRIDVGR